MLIRRGDGEWRVPAVQAVSSEDELQALLATTPGLLPGPEDIRRVAVREFPVDGGYIDVLAVDADGSISIIECKLRANPEIRRQVLGQVLSYAAALWQTPFEYFEAAFERRAGRALFESPEWTSDAEFNPDDFRRSVAANLRSGAFRVVVAVDEITDELKQAIVYLNERTGDELEIIALELGLVRDGDVQVLIPNVWGEEVVRDKRIARRPGWNEEAFWEHAEAESSNDSMQAIRRMYEWATAHGARFYWGEGKHHPSMTAWIPLRGGEGPLWTCYLGDNDQTQIGLNFEWLLSRVGEAPLKQLAHDLAVIPEAREAMRGLEEAGYRRRPGLPILTVRRNGVLTTLLAAYDALISSAEAGEAPTDAQA